MNRTLFAVAALAAVALLMSAQQRFTPIGYPGELGWAGPHPSMVRSYQAAVDVNQKSSILIPSAPGITGGFVITDIHVNNHFEDEFFWLSVDGQVVWRTRVGPTQQLHFASGIPVPKGAQVVAEQTLATPTRRIDITVSGYVW